MAIGRTSLPPYSRAFHGSAGSSMAIGRTSLPPYSRTFHGSTGSSMAIGVDMVIIGLLTTGYGLSLGSESAKDWKSEDQNSTVSRSLSIFMKGN
uniref:Uncharacterized protein n=1 Tax=Arabidopsis thaliana TaxID=3702 RepID=Q0WUY3_ARATH|nr:hypothetical protein [Arabidopsis thaliana]